MGMALPAEAICASSCTINITLLFIVIFNILEFISKMVLLYHILSDNIISSYFISYYFILISVHQFI